MLNFVEQNAILFYADYLSLRQKSRPVTDNCKYYYIYGAPINLAFLEHSEPFYSKNNKFYIEANKDYQLIKDKFGEDGVLNFVNSICNFQACGNIDAKLMLKQIHQFSTKAVRKTALKDYSRWKSTQHYSHIILNENGDPERKGCTMYIAHAEQGTYHEPQCYYTRDPDKILKIPECTTTHY